MTPEDDDFDPTWRAVAFVAVIAFIFACGFFFWLVWAVIGG